MWRVRRCGLAARGACAAREALELVAAPDADELVRVVARIPCSSKRAAGVGQRALRTQGASGAGRQAPAHGTARLQLTLAGAAIDTEEPCSDHDLMQPPPLYALARARDDAVRCVLIARCCGAS